MSSAVVDRETLFRFVAAKAVTDVLEGYFNTVSERIRFLQEARVEAPSHFLRNEFQVPNQDDDGEDRLPVACWVWKREKICLLWVEVPLNQRMVGINEGEFYCGNPLEYFPLFWVWLKENGLASYDTFFRLRTPPANYDWWEMEATFPPVVRRTPWDTPAFIWSMLRRLGNQWTKSNLTKISHPLDEPRDEKLLRKLADRAVLVADKWEVSLDISVEETRRERKAKAKAQERRPEE